VTDLINFISNILWKSVLIYLLLGVGLYFTLCTRFILNRPGNPGDYTMS